MRDLKILIDDFAKNRPNLWIVVENISMFHHKFKKISMVDTKTHHFMTYTFKGKPNISVIENELKQMYSAIQKFNSINIPLWR